jgi:hypothetical protein
MNDAVSLNALRGEAVELNVDEGGGVQEYVEDCPVAAAPGKFRPGSRMTGAGTRH